MHINVVGDAEEDERTAFKKAFKDSMVGAENAGGAFVTWSPDTESAATITPIQTTQNADTFTAWKEDTVQSIVTAHSLSSPTLAGISGSGNLSGNANEMIVALELFTNNYVKGKQDNISQVITKLIQFKGFEGIIVTIANVQPFSVVPDVLWDIMTDEDIERIASEKFGIKLTGTSINRSDDAVQP